MIMQSGCNIIDFLQEQRLFVRKITNQGPKKQPFVFITMKKGKEAAVVLFPLLQADYVEDGSAENLSDA